MHDPLGVHPNKERRDLDFQPHVGRSVNPSANDATGCCWPPTTWKLTEEFLLPSHRTWSDKLRGALGEHSGGHSVEPMKLKNAQTLSSKTSPTGRPDFRLTYVAWGCPQIRDSEFLDLCVTSAIEKF